MLTPTNADLIESVCWCEKLQLLSLKDRIHKLFYDAQFPRSPHAKDSLKQAQKEYCERYYGS